MVNKKNINNKYIFICTIICICIILLFFISNHLFKKNQKENFSSISKYPKHFIEENCNIYLKSTLKEKDNDDNFCTNSAFVKDGKLLENLCQVNGNFQILEVDSNNSKNKFIGCTPNKDNLLGLKWENPNINDVPNRLYSVPYNFYNLYFNNNPYKGTWDFKPTIGKINLDGSNFMKMKEIKIGTLNSMNIQNNKNFSISLWVMSNSNNNNILQVGNSVCDLKVDGNCKKYCEDNQWCTMGKKKYWWNNWFTSSREGPKPSTESVCIKQKNNWKDKCGPSSDWWVRWWNDFMYDDTDVSMYYTQGNFAINLVNSGLNIFKENYYNWNYNTLNKLGNNKWNSLNHIIVNFHSNKIQIYLNGELVQTSWRNAEVSKNDPIYLGKNNPNGLHIKNLIFWDTNFNERYAHDLYQSYLPIIRVKNKIRLIGTHKKNDNDSFKAPFKLNKRLFLGRYGNLNFLSNKSITISFTINVKKNYSNWTNILLITDKNYDDNVRKPGIWLWPNKCALNICRSTDESWNECLNYDFTLGKDVHFKIIYNDMNKEIILYENHKYKTNHICRGNFIPVTKEDGVWVGASMYGVNEHVEISNYEIMGGLVENNS